jgi:type II secretory pathway pseudopilin PulG
MTTTNRRLLKTSLLLFACFSVLAVMVVVSGMRAVREAHCDLQSLDRLAAIGIALEAYQEANGCYPPAYLVGKDGKPAHSWRVLLLPYLEYDDLYERYDFDEPWNGPHNRLLVNEIPLEYCSPLVTPEEYESPFEDSKSATTPYLAIVGPDTAWPGAAPLKPADIQHRPNTVIRLLEAANSNVNWMEPRDITYKQALAGITSGGKPRIKSYHAGHIPALLLSHEVVMLPINIPRDIFRAMLTVTGPDTLERPLDASGFDIRSLPTKSEREKKTGK